MLRQVAWRAAAVLLMVACSSSTDAPVDPVDPADAATTPPDEDGGVDGGGPQPEQDGAPQPGKAVALNGSSQYATLPSGTYVNAPGFTFELWFRLAIVPAVATGRQSTLLSLEDAAACEDTYLGFGDKQIAGDQLTFRADGQGGCTATTEDQTPLTVTAPGGWKRNVWYHVAAVRDVAAKKAYLYLNGVAAEHALDVPAITRALAPVLGRSGTAAYFGGAVDELRLYTRALTADEVVAHYASGAGTYGKPETGLELGYHFDEPNGSATAAAYTTGANATLVGGVPRVAGIVFPAP